MSPIGQGQQSMHRGGALPDAAGGDHEDCGRRGIYALDSANYGYVTINKAVSILSGHGGRGEAREDSDIDLSFDYEKERSASLN
jgi:hypothetical protein